MPSRLFLCLATLRLFFFNPPATPEIYTLSLHDALPSSTARCPLTFRSRTNPAAASSFATTFTASRWSWPLRSEEHTSELQSRENLVCRLLLEKKKTETHQEQPPVDSATLAHRPQHDHAV